jgi:hypothetical protein
LRASGGYRGFPADDERSRNHGETCSARWAVLERLIDPSVRELLMPVDTPGVDAQQDRDPMPGTAGDLGGRYPSVQAERYAAVPQVVRPTG